MLDITFSLCTKINALDTTCCDFTNDIDYEKVVQVIETWKFLKIYCL